MQGNLIWMTGYIRFLSNTGLDPLKNNKATKPAFKWYLDTLSRHQLKKWTPSDKTFWIRAWAFIIVVMAHVRLGWTQEHSLNIVVIRFLFLQVVFKKHNCDTCIDAYFWVLMPALEATFTCSILHHSKWQEIKLIQISYFIYKVNLS